MNKKGILLLPLVLLITSCNNTQETARLAVNYLYDTATLNGEKIADLLYESSVLGFELLEKPSMPLIPGDSVTIKYEGEMFYKEIYPPILTLDGTLISNTFSYTYVIDCSDDIVKNDDGGVDYVMNVSSACEYVIIDNQMHYVPLAEYTGSTLYGSVTSNFSSDIKRTPPSPLEIAAFYSFNIRPQTTN